MPGFSDILGNEMIKEYFERTLSNGQISHAYILTGEAGMGRKTLAKTFAMTLLCEENHEGIIAFISDNANFLLTTHEHSINDAEIKCNEAVKNSCVEKRHNYSILSDYTIFTKKLQV